MSLALQTCSQTRLVRSLKPWQHTVLWSKQIGSFCCGELLIVLATLSADGLCLLVCTLASWFAHSCQWSITHVTTDTSSGLWVAACHWCHHVDCLLVCTGTAAVAKASAKQLVCICCKSATRRAAILLQGCTSGTLAPITPAVAAQHVCVMRLAQLMIFISLTSNARFFCIVDIDV